MFHFYLFHLVLTFFLCKIEMMFHALNCKINSKINWKMDKHNKTILHILTYKQLPPPLLTSLRTRHWASLQERVGKVFDPRSTSFTLDEVYNVFLLLISVFIKCSKYCVRYVMK